MNGNSLMPSISFQFIRSLLLSQKRNLQNLSALVFVNFAVAGVGFLTQIKIANTLGKESFGLIAYGMAIATYGAIIIRFGMDKTIVRDLIHFPDKFTEIVKASLVLRFSFLSLFTIAIIVWKLSQSSGNDISWGVVLIIIANSAMSVDLQGVYDSWQKMTRHALYKLVQKGLYFSFIWGILLFDPKLLSIFFIGFATIVSVIIYLFLQYSWAIKRLPTDEVTSRPFSTAFNLARGNLMVWTAALAGLSFGGFNQLVLKQYHGASELGGYAAAWMMVTIVNLLLAQIARVGNPATAHITASSVSNKQRLQFLLKYGCVMVTIVSPIAFLAIIFPKWVLGILFRPEFITAAPSLRILGIYMLLFSFGLAAEQFIISSRMDKTYMNTVLAGGTLGVLLCFAFIPSSGAVGAAMALLFSHGFSLILYWVEALFLLKSI